MSAVATAGQTRAAAAVDGRGWGRWGRAVWWPVLVGILALGVGLRVQHVACCGAAPGWNEMVLTYGDAAANIMSGHGYHVTLAPATVARVDNAARVVPIGDVLRRAPGPSVRPYAYYLPGYAYLIAGLWRLGGQVRYRIPQVCGALLDGLLGPLGLALLLLSCRQRAAALLAAALYATAPPLIDVSTRVLPDSLVTALVTAGLAALVWGVRTPGAPPRARGAWTSGALCGLGGLILGVACWLRGDVLLIIPAVALGLALARRPRAAVLLCAGATGPLIALALLYAALYGGVHLTRPGTGLLLWEAVGQQPNPWGIAVRGGDVHGLDGTAAAVLRAHGLRYGTWAGDRFLLHQALADLAQRPGWFVAPTLARMGRVLAVPLAPLSALLPLPAGLAAVALGWLVLWRRTQARPLALLCAALVLSRVLPFAFLRDEPRFVLALVPVYALCGAVFVAAAPRAAGHALCAAAASRGRAALTSAPAR